MAVTAPRYGRGEPPYWVGRAIWTLASHPAWMFAILSIILGLAPPSVAPPRNGHRRACVLAALYTTPAYCLAVFLIFYLARTPIYSDQIGGEAGRYFVPLLALLAAAMAAALYKRPASQVTAVSAITLGLLSGVGFTLFSARTGISEP
jgi:hypothetical protein